MPRHISETPRPFRRNNNKAVRPRTSRKRPVNLSIDAELLMRARSLKINLSETLEGALRKQLREGELRRFEEEHRPAFDSYNRFIAENGLWGKEYREW